MGKRILSLASIQRLWEKTKGKAWEPPDRDHPTVKALIDGGWLKRCPMRCGFEAFDTGVKWTDAARIALTDKDKGAVPTSEGEG